MSLNNFHDKIISHAESKPDQEVCGVVLLCPDLSVEIKQESNINPDPVNSFTISPQN